ncbi:hypothetical protein L2E82_51551 [Cichorium intybus]|nr:hypothetical protein L2E82_51551 [Cichorium intybus]
MTKYLVFLNDKEALLKKEEKRLRAGATSSHVTDGKDDVVAIAGGGAVSHGDPNYSGIEDAIVGDTFNENSPQTSDPAYISSLGSAVYEAMSTADDNAVWLMQGWLF